MGTRRKLGANSMVVTPGGLSIPAGYADIPSVTSTASQSDFNDPFSFDTFANFSNAFNDDLYMAAQMDAIAQAGIAEGAEAEQREELQRKCAENGLVYNADVGDCVSIEMDNIIRGTLPEDKVDDKDPTLGADASISGAKAIEDYLNQMANDKAFGDLVQKAGLAQTTTQGFAQASDQTRASCAAMGKDFDPVFQVCIPKTSSDGIGGAVGQAAKKAEDILTTVVGGISSVTGIDGLIDKAGEGIADVVGGIVGTLVPGFDADVVINPTGGVSATVTAPNTKKNPNTTQSGVTVGSTSNTQGGTTTVSVDAGDIGNLVIGGGRIADAVDIITGEGTEGGYTQSDLILRAACAAQGKEYDYTSGMCVEKSNKQKPPAPGGGAVNPGGGAVNPGGGDTPPSGGNTTVTVGGQTDAELCARTDYAIANPAKCRPFWDQCSDGKWALKGTCPDPTTTTPATTTPTAQADICPDGTKLAGKPVPADKNCDPTTTTTGKTTDKTTDKAAICPDNTDKKGQTIPAGQTVAWCTEASGVDPKCEEVRAECAKLGKAMKDDCSGCVDTVVTGGGTPAGTGGGTPSGGGSSLPSFIPRSALNVIKQDKPDVVEIDYLYDIGGESIFAPDIQRAAIDGNPYATRAKKGGIIGNANTVDQIISLLGEK